MPVVPPPMSRTVAPSCFSSSTKVAIPAAIGAETRSAISRSQRASPASRVRKAVVPASTTCSRPISCSQCRPRGSPTPWASSAENAIGRIWMMLRPGLAARLRPSCSTRRISASFTERPPTGHCTLNRRLSGWPQDRLTVTFGRRMPASSSAWPTAARIARSASSISTMPPPRTPRPFCQPKPSTRNVPSDSARPMTQTIFVVPMSSTPNGPDWRPRRCGASSPRSGGGRARRDMSFMPGGP